MPSSTMGLQAASLNDALGFQEDLREIEAFAPVGIWKFDMRRFLLLESIQSHRFEVHGSRKIEDPLASHHLADVSRNYDIEPTPTPPRRGLGNSQACTLLPLLGGVQGWVYTKTHFMYLWLELLTWFAFRSPAV